MRIRTTATAVYRVSRPTRLQGQRTNGRSRVAIKERSGLLKLLVRTRYPSIELVSLNQICLILAESEGADSIIDIGDESVINIGTVGTEGDELASTPEPEWWDSE